MTAMGDVRIYLTNTMNLFCVLESRVSIGRLLPRSCAPFNVLALLFTWGSGIEHADQFMAVDTFH
jgi:hypothetical protein